MPYAIMQTDLEAPTAAQLQAAFSAVPGMVAADVLVCAKSAFGILAQGLTAEQAEAAKAGFAAQNVGVEAVELRDLPALPPIRHVRTVDCTAEALVIYDPLGKPVSLAWQHILLIAAGQVMTAEFDRMSAKIPGGPDESMSTLYYKEEKQHERWFLEIIIRGAGLRFSINSNEVSGNVFQYLGDRQTNNFAANFQLLVRDVSRYAPDATLNRGACSICNNATQPFRYPNRTVFNEEIIWLLWKLK